MTQYLDRAHRWVFLIFGFYFSIGALVLIYMFVCNFMSRHYLAQVNRYGDAALEISSEWTHGRNFDEYHRCIVDRYFRAGDAAISYSTFDFGWMIHNWNRDFLAEQPVCKQERR